MLLLLVLMLLCNFIMGCGKKVEANPYAEGDVIEFGTSLAGNDEKLEWIVLECKNSEALLLSKEIIEYRSFHLKSETATEWHNSDICTWLNGDFYNSAFSEVEKDKILECEIQTKNYGSDTADSTQNRIFLLDIKEAEKYVIGKKYAKISTEGSSAKGWFLRDKSGNQSFIAYVDAEGNIKVNYDVEMSSEQGIRPAIRIKIDDLEQE